jgi:DNA-binding response OmpR family regulator
MSRRALVVEDDPILSELLVTLLKRMDFTTHVFHEGTDAAAWVKANRPDLVVLDLMLPGRNGYDICEELKLDRTTNMIPIIIASARAEQEDISRGLRVGANFYLTKPFSIEDFRLAVERVMKHRGELEQTGARGEIHFQIKSDRQHLDELNDLFSSLLLFSGLDENQIFQLTTAVREMGNNAIEWGNRQHIERPVTVRYRIDQEKVEIVIRDEGSGFNRDELPHAVQDEENVDAHLAVREEKGLRMGGFGIFMAKKLVDELSYNEAGNEVTLVKRIAKPRA